MIKWYNKYYKNQDYVDICQSTFLNQTVNLPLFIIIFIFKYKIIFINYVLFNFKAC
jgi:hypothetical protein